VPVLLSFDNSGRHQTTDSIKYDIAPKNKNTEEIDSLQAYS